MRHPGAMAPVSVRLLGPWLHFPTMEEAKRSHRIAPHGENLTQGKHFKNQSRHSGPRL